MKIPGLTFIIVPILGWLIYINYNIIINNISKFYQGTGIFGIVFLLLVYAIIAPIIESVIYDINDVPTYKRAERLIDTVSYKPFKLIYKLLIFINNSLTVKL